MNEEKKTLLFFLRKNPHYSIAGAKRHLALCIGGDLGKQISRVVLHRAEVSRKGRIPKVQLPSEATRNKILQATREVNSVYILGIEKILGTGIVS